MPILRRQPGAPPLQLEGSTTTDTGSSQTGLFNPATANLRTGTMQLPGPPRPESNTTLALLRQHLHGKIVVELRDSVDLSDDMVVRRDVERLFNLYLSEENVVLNRTERAKLQHQVTAEILGYGPIQELINDDRITEIMVNGPSDVWIEQNGRLTLTEINFQDNEHVMRIINRIVAPLGRHVDEASPMVDARLPDGSRVNVIIPPLSLAGPAISIRKFSKVPYTSDDLVRFGSITEKAVVFLEACVKSGPNVIVSGGTGSGKTTFLNVLSSFIPNDERIVTIEDAAELQLRQEHVVTLEARPANIEGEGEITIRNLLRNAMHMRPDRIIVGECRSGEALDMLQAMTTGHDGSLSTGHANSPKDMLRRLETMVLMTGYDLPLRAIREQIASAIDLIVHTARLKDGTRKVVNITEVYGIDDDEILTQDIFAFEQTDFRDGKIIGELSPTNIRPTFMAQFKKQGVTLPPGEFGIPPEDPEHPDRSLKARLSMGDAATAAASIAAALDVGRGRTVAAGGMVYVSAVGPVDPESGHIVSGSIKDQTRRCLANLKTQLEAAGTTLDKVVWANWALREPSEFDQFNEEWNRWFPGDAPMGQLTL